MSVSRCFRRLSTVEAEVVCPRLSSTVLQREVCCEEGGREGGKEERDGMIYRGKVVVTIVSHCLYSIITIVTDD